MIGAFLVLLFEFDLLVLLKVLNVFGVNIRVTGNEISVLSEQN